MASKSGRLVWLAIAMIATTFVAASGAIRPVQAGCTVGSNGAYIPTGYGSTSVGADGKTVTFTATVTGCTVGGPITENWTFGDGGAGSCSTSCPLTHTYGTAASFGWTLSLVATPGYQGPPSPAGANSPLYGWVTTIQTVYPSAPPTLTDFWNGNAYFEKSHYTTSNGGQDDFQELAPIVNPTGDNPNKIWVYYRHNVNGHGEINRATSTDGGLTYTQDNGGYPVICPGNAKWSADSACPASDICQWDAQNVIMPSVVKVGSTYFMVYEGDSELQFWFVCVSSNYMTVGDIGLATSTDGITWTKYNTNGLFLTHDYYSSWQCNNIGGPSVTYLNGQFYVFFHGNCGSPSATATTLICEGLNIPNVVCSNGATACTPILNSDGSPNLNSSCPYGFRFDSLRNKAGMVHASGTDLTQLQNTLENQVVGFNQPTELPPIMDIGIGAQSWDSRVNGRPNVIYEGGYYYLFFEGAQYAFLDTFNGLVPGGVYEGNWGWGVARTSDINSGSWEKYAYNPIRQDFQNSNSGLYQQPYVFQISGVTWVYMWHPGGVGQSSVLLWGTDPYLHIYPAVNNGAGQCEFKHNLGFIDGSGDQLGWAQTTGVNNDYLCYGPYQPFSSPNDYSAAIWPRWVPGPGAIPAGEYAVTFRSMIDSTSCSGDFLGICAPVVTYDITHNSGNVRDSIFVPHRNDYQKNYQYQNFEQQFSPSVAASPYEWRTFFDSHAYTRVQYVFLRQIDGQYSPPSPSASIGQLPANAGLPLTVSWNGGYTPVGIWSYNVQYQVNMGGWTSWLQATPSTSATLSSAQCLNNYGFQVQARDFTNNLGSYSGTVSTYIACDFSVSSDPTSVPVQAGLPGTSTITVTPINGYSDPVSLSVDHSACNLNPTSLHGSGSSTLSCTFSSGGSYSATVTGTGDGLTRQASVSFAVQDFTISASGPLVTNAGTSSASTISVTAVNGLTGTVQLVDIVPTGLTCSSINPTSLTLAPSPTAATLTCNSNVVGNYPVIITGTYNGLSHSTSATFQFTGSLTTSASPTQVPPDGRSSSTITAQTSNNQPNVLISLSANFGTLSATSCTTGPTGSCSVTITSSLAGVSTVTATAPFYSNGATSVSFFDFTISTSPLAIDGQASAFCGAATNACPVRMTTAHTNDVIIAYMFEARDSSAPCSFSISDSAGLVWTQRSLAFYGPSGLLDEIAEFWAKSSGILSNDLIVESISSCGNNFNGLQAFGVTGANFNNPFDPNTSLPSANAGNGFPALTISTTNPNDLVIGAGLVDSYCFGYLLPANGFPITPPGSLRFCTWSGFLPIGGSAETEAVFLQSPQANFPIAFTSALGAWEEIADAITPNPIMPDVGSSVSSSVVLSSLGGSFGTVALTDLVPSGLSCGPIVPSSLSVPQLWLATATLTCTSVTAGTYSVTITGTSGTISHSTTATFSFGDFAVSATPGSVTTLAQAYGTSTISVTSLNGYARTVTFAATFSPSGLNCWTSPASLVAPGSATLYCYGPIGAYTVTVTGTDGSLTRSVTVAYTIRDFTLTATPSVIVVPAGRSATVTVQSTSINGYSGTITLGTQFIYCATTSFSKPSLQLLAGGTDSATLTMTMAPTCYSNQYSTSITGYDSAFNVARYAGLIFNITDYSIYGQTSTTFGVSGATTLNYNITYAANNNYQGSILTQKYSWGPNNCCLSTSIPSIVTLAQPDTNSQPNLVTTSNDQEQPFTFPFDGNGFYAMGRDWIFFKNYGNCAGTTTNCLNYATSTSGASWTTSSVSVSVDDTPSILTNGTAVFYIRYGGMTSQSGFSLMLGVGVLHADGTIAWQPEKTVVSGASGVYYYHETLRISTTGQIFVAYNRLTSQYGPGYPHVIHSNGLDYTTWQQDTQLIPSSSHADDYQFSIVPLPNGQMYVLYWQYQGSMFGSPWSNGAWGSQETVSSNTQQVAFGFTTGNSTVYAIWQDSKTKNVLFDSRPPAGPWGTSPQTIFTADVSSNPHWTASYDPLHGKWYVFYYSYNSNQIWEYSGDPGAWSSKTILNTTYGAGSGSTFIGSFYNSAQVNPHSSTLGIFWTQYDSSLSTLQLKFANATILTGGSVSATWPIISTGSGSGSTTLTVTASDGYISRSITLYITVNGYNVTYWYNPLQVTRGSSSAIYLQIFPEYGIPLTSATIQSVNVPSCLTVSTPNPSTFNIGPINPYDFPTLPVSASSSCLIQNYTVVVKISGTSVHTYDMQLTFTVTVVPPPPNGGGGGGSVAAGTLITLADGSQVPVQNLQQGMQLLSYDLTTHQYVVTTITKFVSVVTYNQMEIHTANGKPLIVDQNPAQKLYVKLPDGTITLMSVTDLRVGYDLFDAISQSWTPITSIRYQNGGTHLMYDIYTTSPGNYIANGYLDPLKT